MNSLDILNTQIKDEIEGCTKLALKTTGMKEGDREFIEIYKQDEKCFLCSMTKYAVISESEYDEIKSLSGGAYEDNLKYLDCITNLKYDQFFDKYFNSRKQYQQLVSGEFITIAN